MNTKTKLILALTVVVLTVITASAFRFWNSPDEVHAEAAVAEKGADEGSTGDREILYWRAPMNPNEIYDEPGKSNMGMDLVPVYADQASGDGVVKIDPVTMQNMGVRTARAEVMPLGREVRTTGRFQADEQRATVVSTKVSGWIEKLHADFEGARVRRGQPLLEIYSPELVSTQEEYLLALRNAERLGGNADAQRLVDAARRRLSYWDISDEQIAKLEETGTPTKTLTLYAPASGTVENTQVVVGQKIHSGQTLMSLSDLSNLWLMVDLFEQDLAWIDVGTPVTVELPYAPGQRIAGRVGYIYDELDADLRAVKARIEVSNPRLDLKPGMYATVQLTGREAAPAPVVPAEAVITSGKREVVVLALGDGRFKPAEVRTGLQSDGRVQIMDGLEGGETVVTSAQFLIDSEARLQSAVNAMASKAKGDAAPETETAEPAGMDEHAGMDMEMETSGDAGDGTMDHGTMDHGSMDHGSMDDEVMDHEAMEHESMNHEAMNHGSMQMDG